jgi:hypothetical protein
MLATPSPPFHNAPCLRGHVMAGHNPTPAVVTWKACSQCGEEKLLPLFAIDKRTASGLSSWCRDCKNEQKRTYRKTAVGKAKSVEYHRKDSENAKTPEGREKHRRYFRSARSRGIGAECARRQAAKSRARYPERAKARRLLRDAVEKGIVIKANHCENCGVVNPLRQDGKSALHGHHHRGYGFPLDVIWLCALCHSDSHRARGEARP